MYEFVKQQLWARLLRIPKCYLGVVREQPRSCRFYRRRRVCARGPRRAVYDNELQRVHNKPLKVIIAVLVVQAPWKPPCALARVVRAL